MIALVSGQDRPQFHDPSQTRVFPQAVVGFIGGLLFEAEVLIGNTGDDEAPMDLIFWPSTRQSAQGDGSLIPGIFFRVDDGPAEALEPFLPNRITVPAHGSRAFAIFVEENGSAPGGLLIGSLITELALKRVAAEASGAPSPAIEDIVYSFVYNIYDSEGNLIDTVPVPEAVAGNGFEFVIKRNASTDVGFAVFVTQPMETGYHLVPARDLGQPLAPG